MKLKKLTATLVALGIAAPAWAADFTIKNFRIEGEQHTSEATVRCTPAVFMKTPSWNKTAIC